MSKSKFTPGPWSLKVFGDGAFILTEGDDTDDLKNCVIASRNAHNSPEESKANARLMADTPLMYEILQKFVGSHVPIVSDDVGEAMRLASELLNRHGG